MMLLIPAVVVGVQPSEVALVFDFDLNAFYRKNTLLPLNSTLRRDNSCKQWLITALRLKSKRNREDQVILRMNFLTINGLYERPLRITSASLHD